MVTTLENHHSEILYRIQDVMDDAITRDSVKDIFRSEHTTIASVMTRDIIALDHTKTAHDAVTIMMQKKDWKCDNHCIWETIWYSYRKGLGAYCCNHAYACQVSDLELSCIKTTNLCESNSNNSRGMVYHEKI